MGRISVWSILLTHREELALLILRLALSLVLGTHGFMKLFHPRLGPRRFADYLQSVQVPLPLFVAYFIGILEFTCALCLITGFLTHWAATLLTIHVAIAIIVTGGERGFTRLPEGVGYEFEVVLLGGLLALVILGGGNWSVGWQFFGWR